MEGIIEDIKRMQAINVNQAEGLKQLYEMMQEHSSPDSEISKATVKEKRLLEDMDAMFQAQTKLLKEQGKEILESVEKVEVALNETKAKVRVQGRIQIATLVISLLWVSAEGFLAWKAGGMMVDMIEGLPTPLKWMLKSLKKKARGEGAAA